MSRYDDDTLEKRRWAADENEVRDVPVRFRLPHGLLGLRGFVLGIHTGRFWLLLFYVLCVLDTLDCTDCNRDEGCRSALSVDCASRR